MFLRFAALAVLSIPVVFGQTPTPAPVAAPATVTPEAAAPTAVVSRLRADESDPLVVRARERAEQIRKMVAEGALPAMRFKKAQDEVQDALDMSLLRQSLYSTDLLPEEADQMVVVAQQMVIRRQRTLLEMRELVSAGILAQNEADVSTEDFNRAQQELDWARSRAKLVEQIAETARIQKGIASLPSSKYRLSPTPNGWVRATPTTTET